MVRMRAASVHRQAGEPSCPTPLSPGLAPPASGPFAIGAGPPAIGAGLRNMGWPHKRPRLLRPPPATTRKRARPAPAGLSLPVTDAAVAQPTLSPSPCPASGRCDPRNGHQTSKEAAGRGYAIRADRRPAETASFFRGRNKRKPLLIRTPRTQTLRRHAHSPLRTCAQMAIIPRNSDSEARAAASSTTARNMANPCFGFGLPSRPNL